MSIRGIDLFARNAGGIDPATMCQFLRNLDEAEREAFQADRQLEAESLSTLGGFISGPILGCGFSLWANETKQVFVKYLRKNCIPLWFASVIAVAILAGYIACRLIRSCLPRGLREDYRSQTLDEPRLRRLHNKVAQIDNELRVCADNGIQNQLTVARAHFQSGIDAYRHHHTVSGSVAVWS